MPSKKGRGGGDDGHCTPQRIGQRQPSSRSAANTEWLDASPATRRDKLSSAYHYISQELGRLVNSFECRLAYKGGGGGRI